MLRESQGVQALSPTGSCAPRLVGRDARGGRFTSCAWVPIRLVGGGGMADSPCGQGCYSRRLANPRFVLHLASLSQRLGVPAPVTVTTATALRLDRGRPCPFAQERCWISKMPFRSGKVLDFKEKL